MKLLRFTLFSGLCAFESLTLANPIPDGDVVLGTYDPKDPTPLESRDLDGPVLRGRGLCNRADEILQAASKAPIASVVRSFCSSFIQQTKTVSTTFTVNNVVTAVTTIASPTITERTTVTVPGPIATCPAPRNPPDTPQCGITGFGPNTALIRQVLDLGPYQCQVLCLTEPGCLSFQVDDAGTVCNLYRATVGDLTILSAPGFKFYDVECSNFLPAACSGTPAKQKRGIPIPSVLRPLASSKVSSVCSCLITPPLAVTNSIVATETLFSTTTEIVAVATTIFETETVTSTAATFI